MKKNYISAFDGLRAIGVIGVIAYHLFPQTVKGGYLGVVLFFYHLSSLSRLLAKK
ncbi:hypothetical protein [Streptococcus saliviloxodontae]|uniref:Peptidoglycan/LPS O-acetylase OafA/YrhL n=1 Tax=Streptococcus saliviloxodontae TaxID=1349416 RepID=A0ABS2PNN9_9STRE|nr:hypothetical protein [Streptococcus saliviloxodontae]MBM7637058.1 peptidoglycan/LPS O-acetylase OafA/YrhL [Streptococcus saliviloxodontae]